MGEGTTEGDDEENDEDLNTELDLRTGHDRGACRSGSPDGQEKWKEAQDAAAWAKSFLGSTSLEASTSSH